jgi:hypothetical protein
MKRHLTNDQRAEIIRRINDGEKGKTLADEYGVSSATISNIIRNFVPTNNTEIPDDIKEQIFRYGFAMLMQMDIDMTKAEELRIKTKNWLDAKISFSL